MTRLGGGWRLLDRAPCVSGARISGRDGVVCFPTVGNDSARPFPIKASLSLNAFPSFPSTPGLLPPLLPARLPPILFSPVYQFPLLPPRYCTFTSRKPLSPTLRWDSDATLVCLMPRNDPKVAIVFLSSSSILAGSAPRLLCNSVCGRPRPGRRVRLLLPVYFRFRSARNIHTMPAGLP